MYGDQSTKLNLETRAQLTLNSVKPYNDDLVRSLLLETKQLHGLLTTLLMRLSEGGGELGTTEIEAIQSQLLILHLTVQYNKRCLLVYHNTRLDILSSLVGESFYNISILHTRHPNLTSNLSIVEQDYLRSYISTFSTYKLSIMELSNNLDLNIADFSTTQNNTLPKSLLVTVRTEKDLNDLWISKNSQINAKKNQILTLHASEIQNLLAKGWVTLIDQ